MSVQHLTDEQIAHRLNVVERWIQKERDEKKLPTLNLLFQTLIEEQVRRDLATKP